jgi:hypothetical protein
VTILIATAHQITDNLKACSVRKKLECFDRRSAAQSTSRDRCHQPDAPTVTATRKLKCTCSAVPDLVCVSAGMCVTRSTSLSKNERRVPSGKN